MNLLLKIAPFVNSRKCFVLVYVQGTEPSYSLFSACQQKGEVKLDRLIENSTELDLLNDRKLKLKGQPVVLSLFGDGLVQRSYKGDIKALNSVIPNINVNAYCLRSCEFANDQTFVALLRLNALEKVVEAINGQNILIGHISLGFVDIVRYQKALSIRDTYLFVGNHYLQFIDGTPCETGKKDPRQTDKMSSPDPFSGLSNAAMGAALSFFLNEWDPGKPLPGKLESNRKELVAAKIHALLINYALPGFLVLLLANFFLFNTYQKKIEGLSGSLGNTTALTGQIEQLKKQIEDEKEFYFQANLHKNRQFAYYVDRIASLSIYGIRFEELSVNPIKKRIRSHERIEYSSGEIVLKGTADHADCFSQFLVNIATSSMQLTIGKQVYFYDKKEGKAKFEVTLGFPGEREGESEKVRR